jgi:hypothetical protein
MFLFGDAQVFEGEVLQACGPNCAHCAALLDSRRECTVSRKRSVMDGSRKRTRTEEASDVEATTSAQSGSESGDADSAEEPVR